MKKIIFDRYANKLQRDFINQLTEVQKTIEATFTDPEINIFITQSEVADELCRIAKTYENFYGFIPEYILKSVIEMLSDDEEDDLDSVIFSLLQTHLMIEDIIFTSLTPVLKMNETAVKILHDWNEFDDCLDMVDCLVEVTDGEDKTEDKEDNDNDRG